MGKDNNFLLGALVGGLAGAAAALFLTSEKGRKWLAEWGDQEAWKPVKDTATDFLTTAKEKTKEVAEYIPIKANEMVSNVGAATKEAAANAKQRLKETATQMKHTAKEMMTTVEKTISETAPRAKQVADRAAKKVEQAADEVAAQAGNAVDNVAKIAENIKDVAASGNIDRDTLQRLLKEAETALDDAEKNVKPPKEGESYGHGEAGDDRTV
ncbi:hypothetical protein [Geobacillus sp. YF-1]|uniref:hypothetical protein n=1 Tax=Geobacillus sp. YF-1 TaxID=3457480 RepID=UPI00404557E6